MPKYPAPAILLLCLMPPTIAVGQERPINTDRPDFTESPFVVPLGSFQLEAGVMREADHGDTSTLGIEALLRWSPAGRFEFRVELPGYVDGGSAQGITDLGLGIKVELGEIGAWTFGAIAALELPTGSAGTSAKRPEPELTLTGGRDVTDTWSIGMQASLTWLAEPGATGAGSTLVVGRTLTRSVGSFVELAVDREPRAVTSAVLHGGFTFALSSNLQLDLHAIAGLSEAAPTQAVGAGFSTRFQ